MLSIRNPLYDVLFAPFDLPAPTRGESWLQSAFAPAADVRETESGYVLELDVPGLAEKDISLVLENEHLTIKGERQPAENARFNRQERAFGRFERVFHLPDDADGTRVEARVRNGVLTVDLPKRESARARTIEVKAA
jgi:HSP20 family protein